MELQEEQLNPKEKLGARLHAMRVQADLSGKEVAAALGTRWQSKVSRIESGEQLPSDDDIRRWGASCHASDADIVDLQTMREQARIWWGSFKDRMTDGQVPVQQDYNRLVQQSALIRHLETIWVPGLLQVPGYARRVFTEMQVLHGAANDVEASVATRIERQQFLYDPSKRFEFLLDEGVLRHPLPGPAIMREQLDRLQTMIGLERIRFGIIPQNVAPSTTPQNSVQIYAGEEIYAVEETFSGEKWAETAADAAFLQRVIDLQWEDAVEGERARELIIRAVQALSQAA